MESGLVMNLQHSMMPGDIEISSSFIQKQGLSNIDLNAPMNKLGNKIEKIDMDKEADIDSSFEMGLPLNLGGNALMGGDEEDADEDNGLGLPESMLQSTVNFAFENNKKFAGGGDLYTSFEEDNENADVTTHKNLNIHSPTYSKHQYAESRTVSRPESVVQRVVRTIEKPGVVSTIKKEKHNLRGSYRPSVNKSSRKSRHNPLQALNDPHVMNEVSRFSVRSSMNRASYLQFNMMNLDVAINALADQADDVSLYKDYLNMGSEV